MRQRRSAQVRFIDFNRCIDHGVGVHYGFGAAGTSASVVIGCRSQRAERRKNQASDELAVLPAYDRTRKHDGAVWHVGYAVEIHYLRFVHPFEQIRKQIDDDLMRERSHALTAVLARHRVDHAAQRTNHIAQLSRPPAGESKTCPRVALLAKLRMSLAYAETSSPIEDSEFFSSQAFVRGQDVAHRRQCRRFQTPAVRSRRAVYRANQHDVRLQSARLPATIARARSTAARLTGIANINVACRDVYKAGAQLCRITRDVSCALARRTIQSCGGHFVPRTYLCPLRQQPLSQTLPTNRTDAFDR